MRGMGGAPPLGCSVIQTLRRRLGIRLGNTSTDPAGQPRHILVPEPVPDQPQPQLALGVDDGGHELLPPEPNRLQRRLPQVPKPDPDGVVVTEPLAPVSTVQERVPQALAQLHRLPPPPPLLAPGAGKTITPPH